MRVGLLDDPLLRNLDLFLQYNKERVSRLLLGMPVEKRPLFQVLPFLVHSNLPGFPGYIPVDEAPHGIIHFNWTEKLEATLYDMFPNQMAALTVPANQPPDEIFINSLMLMGSLGTIAQSPHSDFDYWVCVRYDGMSDQQMKLLERKLTQIELWAESQHELEVHFFITDIANVRRNQFGTAGKESVGSSQGQLLKEEFYRTLIFVAGKVPFWWLTPAGSGLNDYRELKKVARGHKQIKPKTLIDLGHQDLIATDEFFGAAIWQISKAMDSPYKSALKIAMLEVYMDERHRPELMCDILKRRVQTGIRPSTLDKDLDPYTIFVDTILDYYHRRGRQDVHQLLQICIYLKSDYKGNLYNRSLNRVNFKHKIMYDYITEWGWDQKRLDDLNSYQHWDFEKVKSLGQAVHQYLIDTYQSLSERLKNYPQTKQLISSQDLTVIGRKISSFYSQKPNKINIVKRAFPDGLWLESVSLNPKRPNLDSWTLYRGTFGPEEDEMQEMVLRSGEHLPEILIWAIINRMITPKTSLYLVPSPAPVSMLDLQTLVSISSEMFPKIKISEIPNEPLLENQEVLKVLFIVNFTSQRWKDYVDALQIVYLTSWGEFFCASHKLDQAADAVGKAIHKTFDGDTSVLRNNFKILVPQGPRRKKLLNAMEKGIKSIHRVKAVS